MKKLVTALVVALICAGIGAAYLWREWRDVRDVNASFEARVQTLESRQSAATATPAAHGTDISAVSAATAAVPIENEVASSQAAADTKPAMARIMITQMYPDLAQELSLAPDELDKFLDLLASQETNAAYDPKKREADQAAIAAMLGSKYSQWQDYQQTLTGRRQINQLRGELAATGSALPEAQVRPLMDALNAELKRIDQDARDKPMSRVTNQQEATEQEVRQMTEANRRMIAAATPYLAPQQLESYRQMLDRQLGMMRTVVSVGATQSQPATAK